MWDRLSPCSERIERKAQEADDVLERYAVASTALDSKMQEAMLRSIGDVGEAPREYE